MVPRLGNAPSPGPVRGGVDMDGAQLTGDVGPVGRAGIPDLAEAANPSLLDDNQGHRIEGGQPVRLC